MNRLSQAVEAYSQATKLNGREARYWFNLGNVLMAVRAAPQAKGAFEKAYQLRPHDNDIALNFGIATRNRAIIEKASSRSAVGKQVLAQMHWQDQNLREACDLFSQARKLASTEADIVLQEVLCRLQVKGKRKNASGWKEEVEDALELRRDKNAVFAFLAKSDLQTAKKARTEELKALGFPVHDKIDLIRFDEQRQKWQSEFAYDCVAFFGMDGTIGYHEYNVNVFPEPCGYGIVWTFTWQKILNRIKDGALDNMKATKKGFRDFLKGFAVAIVGSGRGGSCAFAWLAGRECVAVDVLCSSMRHAGDNFYCRQLGWNYLPPDDSKKKSQNKTPGKNLKTADAALDEELDRMDEEDVNPVWPETPEDQEYALYMRGKQVGAVVLLSQFWHHHHVKKEIEFWAKEMVASGDLFIWKEDYLRNKEFISKKFDVLFYHGMDVSWSKEEKMLVQLQRKIDDLQAQVDKSKEKSVLEADAYFEFVNAKRKEELHQALGSRYDPKKTIAKNEQVLYEVIAMKNKRERDKEEAKKAKTQQRGFSGPSEPKKKKKKLKTTAFEDSIDYDKFEAEQAWDEL